MEAKKEHLFQPISSIAHKDQYKYRVCSFNGPWSISILLLELSLTLFITIIETFQFLLDKRVDFHVYVYNAMLY